MKCSQVGENGKQVEEEELTERGGNERCAPERKGARQT